jgi:dipeptidyl aminopeptidase/acylaminoacyl peptidase
MTRGLRASDMFRLALVADPRLSADGRYVAYVRGCLDRAADAVVEETVVADLGTGEEWRPGPGGLRTARPRWAPDGSGGYGRRFATAIRGGWGGADWTSLERLIDAVAATPGIDAGRAAITGVSYGGYLSMWAITRSARFCAAISENGISDLLAEWGAEGDDGAWLTTELGGPPWERPDVYVASSPIAAADRIRTPLLLIHADLDRNCPIGQRASTCSPRCGRWAATSSSS